MTNFNRYFLTALGPRLRTLGNALLLDAAIVSVLTLTAYLSYIGDKLDATTFMGFVVSTGVFLLIGVFVRLATRTERTWGSNLDRLLPLGDGYRYLAQQLATLLSFSLFTVLQGLMWAAGGRWFLGSDNTSVDPWLSAFFITLIVLLVLWGFTLVSLVHLTTTTITAFIAPTHQKGLTNLVYLGVIVLVIGFLNGLNTVVKTVFGPHLGRFFDAAISVDGNHLGAKPGALLVTLALMLALIAAASALNVYLLSRWTETKAQLY